MDVLARHQCLIYSGSPSKHLAGIAALMFGKVKTGYRCLVLNSPQMVTAIRSYLDAVGLDVDYEVARGSLVLSSDQSHLVNGQFDVSHMLNAISAAVKDALGAGYEGLWATGDMTWEFGQEKNFDKLLEYELGLEKLFHAFPALSGVCQYHQETLPPDAVRTAIRAHRALYVNETLSRVNPNSLGSDSQGLRGVDLTILRLDDLLRDDTDE